MGGWQGMGWGMGWGWLFLSLLVVGLLLLATALMRGWGGGKAGPRPSDGSRAREILEERYARGEIDFDEFQDRLQQLRHTG